MREKGKPEKLLREIQGLADTFRSEHLDKWYEKFLNTLAEKSNSKFWKEASNTLLAQLHDSIKS